MTDSYGKDLLLDRYQSSKSQPLQSQSDNDANRARDAAAALFAQVATPANTTAAYIQAVDHFCLKWGGLLPASELSIVRYITDHAGKLAVSTLKLRLAALANWHRVNGFTDPTKGVDVKLVMKGIARTHIEPQRKATPLPFDYLQKIVQTLEANIQHARSASDRPRLLRLLRNRALLLLGFWRGARSDELTRVRVEHIKVYRGEKLMIFLGHSKTDSEAKGAEMSAPALRWLCPVEAYIDWISESDLKSGPVFRKIDRWGNVGDDCIFPRSVGPLLREMAKDAGLDIHLSTHSLRHGFANWAADMGWDVRSIMAHVGWTNYENAARYVPARYDYGSLAIGGRLISSTQASLPAHLDNGHVITLGHSSNDS